MKNLVFTLIAAVLLAACSSDLTAVPATATTPPKPTDPPPTAYQATLFCQDCADAGMEINLWETPERDGLRTTGSVPHNTAVTVLDSRMVNGTRHYKVRHVNVVGWVSELMVKK